MAFGGEPFKSNNRSQRLFRPKRRSRRGWVISIVAIVAVIGLLWLWAFQQAPRTVPAGGVPIIKADDQPMRKRPDEPGGMKIPDMDKLVYDSGKAEPKVEHLLPPPETPLPRPLSDTPQATSNGAAPASPVPNSAAAPTAPAPQTQVAVAPATVPPPAGQPQPVTGSAKPPTAPAAAAPAAPKPVVTNKLPGDKGYRLQLASVRSADDAAKVWEKLKHANADVLGSMNYSIMSVDLGERGTYYRVMAGPIAEQAAATFACDQLKQRSTGCILVKP